MDFPYVTERFTAYAGNTISTNLSLAVWLTDDYTKKRPIGKIRIGEIKAVKNLSGYYLFTDLVHENYSIKRQN